MMILSMVEEVLYAFYGRIESLMECVRVFAVFK